MRTSGKGLLVYFTCWIFVLCVRFFFPSRNDLSSWEADRMDPTKRERLVRIMGDYRTLKKLGVRCRGRG